jgi:hypothetical protein
MSNWAYVPPYNLGQPGSTTVGGGGEAQTGYRDALDAARSGVGFLPHAQYPDGYLGTITNRREDKLLNAIQSRLTNRSYQRGVHKGERIDPADYYWPEEFNPDTGLEYEARGKKWRAKGLPEERLAHSGTVDWATPQELGDIYAKYDLKDVPGVHPPLDPVRAAQLRRFQPTWR